MPLRLFVVKPVEERERELRHPVVDAIRARPEHLPDAATLTAPLHRWRRADLAPFLPALKRVARRRPLGLARALATAVAQALRDRRTRCRARARSTSRSCCRRSRSPTACSTRPTSATCTRTSPTAPRRSRGTPRASPGCRSRSPATRATSTPSTSTRRAGCAASCSRRASSSPAPRPTSATCERIAPGGARPPRLPRPQRRLRAHARRARAGRAANGDTRCASSPSAAWWPRRASTCSSTRAACCARRGVAFEAAIVGQEDKHSGAVRERIAAHGLGGARAPARPDGAGGAAARVPPRERAVHAEPAARRRPRRHPQRARRGDGGGHARDRERRLRHPRAGRARGQRPARRARGPRGAGRHAAAAARRPGALARLAERARETVAGRFDGPRQASRLAELFEEAVRT